jgi:hypothetical protein
MSPSLVSNLKELVRYTNFNNAQRNEVFLFPKESNIEVVKHFLEPLNQLLFQIQAFCRLRLIEFYLSNAAVVGEDPSLQNMEQPSIINLAKPNQIHWIEYKDPMGHSFYHNVITNESKWDRPNIFLALGLPDHPLSLQQKAAATETLSVHRPISL